MQHSEAWVVNSSNVPLPDADGTGEESSLLTHADDPVASNISRMCVHPPPPTHVVPHVVPRGGRGEGRSIYT